MNAFCVIRFMCEIHGSLYVENLFRQLLILLHRKNYAVYFVEICTADVKCITVGYVKMIYGSVDLCIIYVYILILASLQF